MRLLTVLLACGILTGFISCTPQSDDVDPPSPKPLHVDAIATWSYILSPTSCQPFIPNYKVQQRDAFIYDTTGTLVGYIDSGGGQTFKIYNKITYDNRHRINSIVSPYDSLVLSYPIGTSGPYVSGLDWRSSPPTYYKIVDRPDSIYLEVASGSPNVYQDFHAELKRDTAGNIADIVYFRLTSVGPPDTAMAIHNTFNSLTNPCYFFYDKLKVPLFLLMAYTRPNAPFFSIDPVGCYSKNLVAHSTVKIYNNVACTGIPGVTVKEYDYPNSVFFHQSATHDMFDIYQGRSLDFNQTFGGTINQEAIVYGWFP